jgi:RNA polymerase sigma factor (sigma-70 family)
VCNPAYLHLECLSSFISENSSPGKYDLGLGPYEWTNDEIAAIRAALKRLATLRIYNANDVEDLVQDTLLTLISKHPETVLEKGPLVWSLGILRKKVGNYYRKVQRYESLNEWQAGARQWMRSVSPEGKIIHEELRAIVEEVLSQLPSSQRQALELMIAGCDAKEIVKELHPERYQNVINRLYRGRKIIARELAKYGYGPDAAAGMRRMKRSRGRK